MTAFWLKSSLMPHSLAFSSHSRFCVNGNIAIMNAKIACNISFGHCGVRLQVKQPFSKFQYLFSLIKYMIIR